MMHSVAIWYWNVLFISGQKEIIRTQQTTPKAVLLNEPYLHILVKEPVDKTIRYTVLGGICLGNMRY